MPPRLFRDLLHRAFKIFHEKKLPFPRGDPKVSKEDRWGTDLDCDDSKY